MRTELHDRLEDLYRLYRGRVSFAEFLKMLIDRMEARYGPSPGKDERETIGRSCAHHEGGDP